MFKITPIQEKTRQKEICEICDAEFRPDAFAYQMYDIESGEIMGMSQFEIGACGYIYDIKEAPARDDFEAMFIMGRATLNFIDLCGVHYAFYKGEAETEEKQRLIKAIGFKQTESGTFEIDLNGFFTDHCHDKK